MSNRNFISQRFLSFTLFFFLMLLVTGKIMMYLAVLASALHVLQVLVMRFNVVVGGQLISKSGRGFVDFHWDLFGKEGVLTALNILSAPFVTYYVISRVLPIFEEPVREIR